MADEKFILKMARSLSYGNPLRELAERIIADPSERIRDLQPILRALNNDPSRGRRERAIACWLIGNASWSKIQVAQISECLTRAAETAVDDLGPCRRIWRPFRRAAILTTGAATFLVVPAVGSIRYDAPLYYLILMLILSAFVMIVAYWDSTSVEAVLRERTLVQLRPIVDLLGKHGRSGALGPLAKAYTERSIRVCVSSALAKVAARLGPNDYGTGSADSVSALCRALTMADRDTAFSLLYALGTVGDASAIPAIHHRMTVSRSKELREAASCVIAVLNQREARNKVATTLLRSSDPDLDQSLLRVAVNAAPDQEQLLRVNSTS
jgi:hypothetical protein